MNVNLQNGGGLSVYERLAGTGLKSTRQKMERQEKCANQVSFYEQQKENLKTMQCSSLEEIADKLGMLHTYEDQIAAAKKEYNNSQMMSVLDEARERGEKIAEAAEKMEPKTAEERRKEMQEEAAGTEESKGILTEALEEISQMSEEAAEELLEEDLEENIEEQAEQAVLEEPVEPAVQTELEEQTRQRFQDTDLERMEYQHINYTV